MKSKDLPSANYVRTRLHYDPQTGIFVWKHREVTHYLHKTWNTRYAGRRAGRIMPTDGYHQIVIDAHGYLAHRLAWLMMTGDDPESTIDHRNGNKADNRWGNLRAATVSQNTCNSQLSSRNKTGYKGVSYCNRPRPWKATIISEGCYRHLGYHATPEQAAEAYKKAAMELHGEFVHSSITQDGSL